MVRYASRARKRPAARKTASASGRRPRSLASAMASSCPDRWLRLRRSVYRRIWAYTVSLSPSRLLRSSGTYSASRSPSGVSTFRTASRRLSGRRASTVVDMDCEWAVRAKLTEREGGFKRYIWNVPSRLFLGAVFAFVIALVAWRVRALSGGGALAAIVVGVATTAAGWDWATMLIVFFVTSVAL